MPKPNFPVLARACGFSTPALAHELAAEQRTAYEPDDDKYCTGAMLGGGRIIACLNKQWPASPLPARRSDA